MATYWVSTLGDDSDGLTYATAKNAVADGLALLSAKGDILNIVADGTYVWPTSETSVSTGTGTSFTDYGFLIRGVDSSENAAMATIAASGADGARRFLLMRSGSGYNIIQNLIFDATGKAADSNAYTVVRGQDNADLYVRIKECALLGGSTGTVSSGSRTLYEFTNSGGAPNKGPELSYCYYQNCKDPGSSHGAGYGGSTLSFSMDHCIGIWDAVGRTTPWLRQRSWVGAAANSVTFTNNTFFEDAGSGNSEEIVSYEPSPAVDVGTVTHHSNLIYRNTTGGANTLKSYWAGTTSGVTYTGDYDANVLIGGADVDGTELVTAGWYEATWDSGSDIQAADTLAYEKAAADVFNDTASTFAWELPSGLTITILKDLRPKEYQFSGLSGATPGALPTAPTETTPPTDDPADPNDPAAIPFVSVFPFYANVLKVDMNVRMSTLRNRQRKFYLRKDVEEQSMREFASRRVQVATSTTKPIITGLESAEFVFLESDNAVQLSTDGTIFLPEATTVFVAGGSYDTVKVKNASATDAANTLISVVD